jgi:hypothetical protein
VEEKGRPGRAEEDVIAKSKVPAYPFRVVFDAKSRANGRLSELNILTLIEYRDQASASHVVAVAGDFADGKLVRQAKEQGVTLLTVDVLCDLLRLHAATPLCLSDYQDVFALAGVIDALPERVVAAADVQRRSAELLALLIFNLQDVYQNGLDEPLTAKQLSTLLFSRLGEKRFTLPEINATLDFLCNPLIACLQRDSEGAVMLRMNYATFVRRMRTLTDHFESYYEALAAGKAITDQDDE